MLVEHDNRQHVANHVYMAWCDRRTDVGGDPSPPNTSTASDS